MSSSNIPKNDDNKENDHKNEEEEKQRVNAVQKSRPQNSPILSSSALFTTLSVVLPVVVARSGWSNLIFVPVCSAVLLLNPWVRTFLELKPVDDDDEEDDDDDVADTSDGPKKEMYSPFDPARIVRQLNGSSLESKSNKKKESSSKEKLATKAPLDRSGAYAALRRMPAKLRTPISDLEELIVRDCVLGWYNYHSFGDSSFPNEVRYSIDHTIGSIFHATESMKSADVLAELSLAAASVLLVTLRYRRLHPNRAPIFANDETRIQALREALDRVFVRHARLEDGKCDILRMLLREIICKQIWNAICGIGEPDFINQQIVAWGERNAVKETLPSENGYTARDGGQVVPTAAARSSPKPSLETQQSFAGSRKAVPAFSPPLPQTTNQAPQTPAASRSKPTTLAGEPLTTQPKAMTMPSPLSKSGMTPSMMSPTPMQSASRAKITSPTPREVNDYQANLSSLHSGDVTSQPQEGKGKSALPQPSEVSEASLNAWDNVMPMNLPPKAHEGMSLPDSIRDSIKTSEESSTAESSKGYSIPETPEKRKNNAGLSVQTQGDGNRPLGSASTSRSIQSPTVMSAVSPTGDTSSMSVRPPSRAPSAASGGIPPAPELFDVLSNKSDSNAFTPLRDAFENFLERGGVASRSLFFSPPSAATVAPGEGEALLKLHVGLSALARLVPADSNVENDEIFREDAYGILSKAYHNLSDVDDGVAGRALREALVGALNQIQESEELTLRQILRPVETSLWNRLTGLYEYFWKETCTRPSGGTAAGRSGSTAHSGSNTPSRSSFASEQRPNVKRLSREVQGTSDLTRTPSMDLAYEPRRKQPHGSSSTDSNVFTGPSLSPTKSLAPLPEGRNPPRPASSPPMKAPTSRAPQIVEQTSQNGAGSKASTASTAMPPPPLPPQKRDGLQRPAPRRPSQSTLEITVTDVSPNAERPNSNVDLRSFEVMIAVEGLVSQSGGFVLLRNWRDFQQLREELNRSTSLPPLANPPPEGRGKGSAILTREIEAFLQNLLTSPVHMTSEAVQYFVDKGRAGESGETDNSDRIGALMESLQLSKGLNLGRNFASGMVNTIQKGTRTAVGLAPSVPGLGDAQSDASPVPSRSDTFEGVAGPELAHLPIGARPSQGAGHEKVARQGLGIRGNDWPRSEQVSRDAPHTHRRVRSSDLASGKDQQQSPVLNRSPTSPEHFPSTASIPTSGPASELSQADLDNLLSCIFAIADEAFNLSGGWTFRRGMLRVFEQIVRTQYWSSILGVFNNMVHSLSHEQVGNWCKDAKVKFWPDEPSSKAAMAAAAAAAQANASAAQQASSKSQPTAGEGEGFGDAVVEAALDATQAVTEEAAEKTGSGPGTNANAVPPKRTVAQMAATHARAQQILLSHVPSSSAFFFGPGGRQSCERAVICVHEEITQPTTSLDLVLTVVLKLCDIAAR
ncbi:uncharacterized protein FA14DRAFT_74474 [Meira miltonrushii]|uniref:PXA domain-containing protein n=1 Tax=Meira miltonrushii TaxID=1280837 RepID=A0A316VAC7_9BASI|nr:uncharacterized protein FA14DRAFT_74474 [Meira miltonrushii]PWN32465.1 hypothetical protein FA14DRAFT_74474 [Meira miltonrushii]